MENGWCFAVVNGRLAEIFFDTDEKKRKSKIFGHCYVEEKDYKTKYEKEWIEKDIAKYKISYRNKEYKFLP